LLKTDHFHSKSVQRQNATVILIVGVVRAKFYGLSLFLTGRLHLSFSSYASTDRGQPMRDKPSPISVRGRRTNTLFKLKFDPSQIDQLARRYSDDDSKALQAGNEIAAGQYSSQQLRIIHEWKTRGRGKSRVVRNCCENEVAEVIRLAVSTNTTLPKLEFPRAI
jgi:hypothetical protein